MSDAPKPPGPAGTPPRELTAEEVKAINVHLTASAPMESDEEWLERARRIASSEPHRLAALPESLRSMFAPAPAAPVEARVADSVPFVASRGELGAPTAVEHPAPQRLDELARAVAALNAPGTAAIVRELHAIADELRSKG